MKRPLVIVGLTMLFTLLFVSRLDGKYIFVFTTASGALCLISAAFRRFKGFGTLMLILGISALMSGYFGVRQHIVTKDCDSLYDTSTVMTATLIDEPVKYGETYYYKAKITAPQTVYGKKIFITVKDKLDALPFDEVTATAGFYKPSASSYERSMADEVSLSCYIMYGSEIQVTAPEHRPFYYSLITFRNAVSDKIRSYLLLEEGAVISAVVSGDKTYLSGSTEKSFSTAGVFHVLVVSGMHLSIITGALLSLLMFLGFNKRFAAGICIGAALLLAGVFGLTPSVIRAAVMCIIYLLSIILLKSSDSLTSLSVSVILMLLYSPFFIYGLGFLLSVFSVLGIIVLSPYISRFLLKFGKNRIYTSIAVIAAQTLAANMMITPVLLHYFPDYSLVFLLGNLLILPVVDAALILTVFGVIFSFIPLCGFIASPFMLLSGLLAKYMIFAAKTVSTLPFARAGTMEFYVSLWLAVTFVFAGVGLVFYRAKRIMMKVASLSLAVLILGTSVSAAENNSAATMIVPSISCGTAVIVKSDGRTALIGCGADKSAWYGITETLSGMGIYKLDCVIIPSYSVDFAGGASELLNRIEADKLFLPEKPTENLNTYYKLAAMPADAAEVITASDPIIELSNNLFINVSGGNVYIENLGVTVAVASMSSVSGGRADVVIGAPGGLDAFSYSSAVVSGQGTGNMEYECRETENLKFARSFGMKITFKPDEYTIRPFGKRRELT